MGHAGRGDIRLQRQVDATGLEHAEKRRGERQAGAQADAHDVAGARAGNAQLHGHRIRLGVQAGVGPCKPVCGHRRRIGMTRGEVLEQVVRQGCRADIGGYRAVRQADGRYGKVGQQGVRVFGGVKQRLQLRRDLVRGRAAEPRRVEIECDAQVVGTFRAAHVQAGVAAARAEAEHAHGK